MARIFISYSSRDERAALGLQSWLREHAYEPSMVPRTKKQEQGDFDNLQADLQTSIGDAELVLLLVTPFWQASDLCQWEKKEAVSRHKPILAILEAPTSANITDCDFVVDMTKNRDVGLADLKDSLQRSQVRIRRTTQPEPEPERESNQTPARQSARIHKKLLSYKAQSSSIMIAVIHPAAIAKRCRYALPSAKPPMLIAP